MVERGVFVEDPEWAGSEALIRLFDELYDPAFLYDVEGGRFVGVNRAALALLGYDAAEMARLSPSDIHPHEMPRLEAFVDAVLKRGRWAADDLACRTKTGATIPAHVRATRVRLGTRTCILSIVHDRRTDELAALGQSLRRVMHDLRNTLATAQLVGDRLMGHPETTVRRSAETLTRSIERAVEMCRTTLRIGRAAPPPPNRERFVLEDLLDEIRLSLPDDGAHGPPLVAAGTAAVAVDADYDQLYRILLNLVRNAFEAGALRVEVAARTLVHGVEIDVGDDGPGLPAGATAHLFGDDPAVKAASGSGLGLAIARELARNHGGDLTLVASGTAGTTFRLVLPLG